MLENFEIFSVDGDVWASIRNVQAEWHLRVAQAIRKAARDFEGLNVLDHVIIQNGRLIHFEGSDVVHFVYREQLLLAWTRPSLEVIGKTRVHLTYSIGVLEPASEETLRLIE